MRARQAGLAWTLALDLSPCCTSLLPRPCPSQCTGANPRYPTIADLKQILIDAWEQPILPLTSLEFPAPKRDPAAVAAAAAALPAAGSVLSPRSAWATSMHEATMEDSMDGESD